MGTAKKTLTVTATEACVLTPKANGDAFSVAPNEDVELQKGESTDLDVIFKPNARGSYEGSLALNCESSGHGTVSVIRSKLVPIMGLADARSVGSGDVKVDIEGELGIELDESVTSPPKARRKAPVRTKPKRPVRPPSAIEKKGAALKTMVESGESFEARRALELEVAKEGDAVIGRRLGEAASGMTGRIASSVRTALVNVRSSRADGYQQAVSHLTAMGFKDAADIEALALGLADRALWALTILNPWFSAAKAATELLKAARIGIKVRDTLGVSSQDALAAAGPLRQINVSAGGRASDAILKLQEALVATNDRLCDVARDRVHVMLATIIAELEPEPDDSVEKYVASIEMATRAATFGPALDASGGVDTGIVRTSAFNDLLNEFVVQSAVITDGSLAPSAASRKHAPTLKNAVAAMGGPTALRVRENELEATQVFRAANELGCTPALSFDELRLRLTNEEDFLVDVSFDPGFAFKGGGSSRWMHLWTKGIARPRPDFDNAAYLTGSDFDISAIRIAKDQRELARLADRKVAQIRNVDFIARTRESTGPSVVPVEAPSEFSIRFRIK